MTKKEKLLLKAIQNSKNIKVHELEVLLAQFDFKQIKTNAGSHLKWINHSKEITYMCPRKNPVKAIYIKQLIKILKLHFKF